MEADQNRGTAAEAKTFVTDIIEGRKRTVRVEGKQTVVDTNVGKEWPPWKEASDKVSHDVRCARVKSNTVQHRHRKDIPASLGVEWPWYLEVELTSESVRNRTRTLEEVSRACEARAFW